MAMLAYEWAPAVQFAAVSGMHCFCWGTMSSIEQLSSISQTGTALQHRIPNQLQQANILATVICATAQKV
jgi:hypothetical protein